MTELFTPDQAIAAVPGLTLSRLSAFVRADLVQPAALAAGPVYGPIDLARLELLCELADQFNLASDALGVVIGLIDQLHDTRRHLHAMAQALQSEPQDLRHRVGTRFVAILSV